MRRLALAALLVLLASAAAGCSGGHGLAADPSIRVAADLPPSPATWPAYPRFPARSCWGASGSGPARSAPSYAVHRPGSPEQIVRRVLARFGDRRYIKGIRLVSALAGVSVTGVVPLFPPAHALWASIDVPAERHPSLDRLDPQRRTEAYTVPQWETDLVSAALRDEFCAAGGPSLVGWSVPGGEASAGNEFAFGQDFPNQSAAAFRARAALIGRRYGFRVVSIRLLHPLQLAPLVVLETDRRRQAFMHDLDQVSSLLDPSVTGRNSALTFEGMFLVVRDRKGPFATLGSADRGGGGSSEWAWDPCWSPGFHSHPPGRKPCPPGSPGG